MIAAMTIVALSTRFAGLFLLVAGCALLLLAPTLLDSSALRSVFVIAGLFVELVGLAMVGIYHRNEAKGRR
jgi:hypothetical protein